MDARRTFRLLGSFSMLKQAIRSLNIECPWGSDVFSRACYIASRHLMVVWVLLDNLRCLQEIGWVLPGPERVRTTRRINFGAFCIASAISLAYWMKRWYSEALDNGQARQARQEMLKEALNTITFAYVSELVPRNEIFCGAAGAWASAIDICAMWREYAKHKA